MILGGGVLPRIISVAERSLELYVYLRCMTEQKYIFCLIYHVFSFNLRLFRLYSPDFRV
jgi:hypothetical protein